MSSETSKREKNEWSEGVMLDKRLVEVGKGVSE